MKKLLITIILITTSLFAKEISYGNDSKQTFDYYDKGTKEVLFFVHGGAWKKGDKQSSLLNKKNLPYSLVTTNYRLKNVSIEDQINDVYLAYKKTKELIGPDKRLVLSGHSAGAHLVLMTKLKAELKEDIIVIDTSYDYINKKGMLYFAWNNYSKEDRQKLSPFYNLKEDSSKYLIIGSYRNKKDTELFFDKLIKYSKNSTLLQTNFSHSEVNKLIGFNKGKGVDYNKKINQFIEGN